MKQIIEINSRQTNKERKKQTNKTTRGQLVCFD